MFSHFLVADATGHTDDSCLKEKKKSAFRKSLLTLGLNINYVDLQEERGLGLCRKLANKGDVGGGRAKNLTPPEQYYPYPIQSPIPRIY